MSRNMDMKMKNIRKPQSRARQRGAVLFIALMILIILTLLGLSAAQVTVLQERMASAYRADKLAFENAESALAALERATTISSAENNVLCENLYDGAQQTSAWRSGNQLNIPTKVENLGRGAGFVAIVGSLEAGIAREIGDKDCLFLQISAHAGDGSAGDTSHAIVQSIFTP